MHRAYALRTGAMQRSDGGRTGYVPPVSPISEVVVHARLYGTHAIDQVPVGEVTGAEQRPLTGKLYRLVPKSM